jgi:FixJ family two-component response regulator
MINTSKVFIVDDDAAVRDALDMMLKAAGYSVESYSGAEAFLESCNQETGGCIVLDVNMPEMNGPELQAELARRGLQFPIIFLTGQGSIPISVRAMKAGALDFLTKPVDGNELLNCVKIALEKSKEQKIKLIESQTVANKLAQLTEREMEVMGLVVVGLTSKEIAIRLSISYRTVENYRSSIMNKTGASNIIELASINSYKRNE